MKKNHILLLSLAAILVVGLIWVNQPTGDSKDLKIGANFTLSGNLAFWSEQLQKGLDLAIEEANEAKGPDDPLIKIVYEDNQADAGKAVSIWQKLDTIDNVSVVLSCFTPISKPLRENAMKSELPLLAAITSAQDFGKHGKWCFRDYMPQEQQCPAVANYAFDILMRRKAATLVVNDDYGLDGHKEFKKAFEKLGGQVVAAETFEQKDTDMRSQVQKSLEANPDCVFIVGRSQSHALVIKQLRELGFEGQLLGINGFDERPIMKMTADAADGIVFSSAYFDLDADITAKSFKNKYIERYDEEPEHVSVYGYTIGKYLASVVSEANGDREKIRESLATMSVESVRGQLRMSLDRDVVSPIGIYSFNDGKKELIKKVDQSQSLKIKTDQSD